MPVAHYLLVLAAVLLAAKLFGELAQVVRQPAVIGELIAGIILGGSLLRVVDPANEIIHLFAEIGVIILLFEIGLETDVRKLLATGGAAAAVATTGVVLPFAMGFGVANLLGIATLPALVCGAALTATSVGITSRVLSDLGYLQTPEGQIVLGAAVFDDILGLIILAVVSGVVAGGALSLGLVAWTTLRAFAFIVIAYALGRLVIPRTFTLIRRVGNEQTTATLALVTAFLFAIVAERSGSALIIGAFTAGLVFAPTSHVEQICNGVVRIGHFFVPIFFVAIGAAVDVRAFATPSILLLGGVLTVVAIIGKMLAGYAPWWFKGRKVVIGTAMIPRGEVGLIFAQTGLTSGVLSVGEFSAVMLMVMATTFVAPIALERLLARPVASSTGKPREGDRDNNGIAGLTNDA